MRFPARHPSEEQLLSYADGELSARDAGSARIHLASCWECRAKLEECERIIAECVRYRKAVLEDCFPPPPAPWCDIYERFASLDATPGSASFSRRVVAWLRPVLRSSKAWAPAAAALLVAWIAVDQFRNAPSVRAAELLRRAAASEALVTSKPRKIQVRTRTRQFTRPANVVSFEKTGTAEREAEEALAPLFEKARYSWQNPLSAQAFAAWRDQLGTKQDEVRAGSGIYQIRTTTDSGELLAATIKLRVRDLNAIEGTLEFRGETVEISEAPESSGIAVAPGPAGTASPAETGRPVTPAAGEPAAATPSDELRVFALLRSAGADLGEPIEVTRSGPHVLVSGVGVTEERRRELAAQLILLPRVKVEFSEAGPAAAAPQASSVTPQASARAPRQSRLPADIERQLGGRASFEQFSDQILDWNEALLSRAHALRRLAERFPPASESVLAEPEKQLLANLRRAHAAALHETALLIEARVHPVLLALGARPASPLDRFAGSWQAGAQELVAQARRLDANLAVMLGVVAGEQAVEDLPSQLISSLNRLRLTAESYSGLTAAQ